MQELWKQFQDLCSFVNDNIGVIVVFITASATIVEKSPTAFKPISSLLKWLNTQSNKEVLEKIGDIKKEVDGLKVSVGKIDEKVDDNERARIRNEILTFSHALREGKKFENDAFKHIQELYHKYHDKLGGNGLITEEYEYIMSIYNSMVF